VLAMMAKAPGERPGSAALIAKHLQKLA